MALWWIGALALLVVVLPVVLVLLDERVEAIAIEAPRAQHVSPGARGEADVEGGIGREDHWRTRAPGPRRQRRDHGAGLREVVGAAVRAVVDDGDGAVLERVDQVTPGDRPVVGAEHGPQGVVRPRRGRAAPVRNGAAGGHVHRPFVGGSGRLHGAWPLGRRRGPLRRPQVVGVAVTGHRERQRQRQRDEGSASTIERQD